MPSQSKEIPSLCKIRYTFILLIFIALLSWPIASKLPSQFDDKLFMREELEQLAYLRALSMSSAHSTNSKDDARTFEWITKNATDVELLRFIRFHKTSDPGSIFLAIKKHVTWRFSSLGAVTVSSEQDIRSKKHAYDQLAQEIFWLGVSTNGCPTLVIRTQMHDGKMYNEDAQLFTSFVVHMLEEGKRRYGAGSERKVCLLLDRSKVGEKKEIPDFGVVPRLVELFTTLYSTLYPNYPDILAGAQVAPSSWFFSLCYRVTSQVMDPTTRSKFEMIDGRDVMATMLTQFPAAMLPDHLGGIAERYGDDIKYSKEQSLYIVERSSHTVPVPELERVHASVGTVENKGESLPILPNHTRPSLPSLEFEYVLGSVPPSDFFRYTKTAESGAADAGPKGPTDSQGSSGLLFTLQLDSLIESWI